MGDWDRDLALAVQRMLKVGLMAIVLVPVLLVVIVLLLVL